MSAVLVVAALMVEVVEPVIVNATVGEVEELNSAGLLEVNTAISERDPAGRVDVDPDAIPLLTTTGLPRLRVPSRNWTVPVATAGMTVAVNVTGLPCPAEDSGDAVNTVLVATGPAGGVIVKVSGDDVDGLKAVGSVGVKTAISWCGPAIKDEVDPAATPLLTGTGLPMLFAPSLNCTVPVAVAGVIVAVSVTGIPCTADEAGDAISVVLVAGAAVTVNTTAGDVDAA